MTMKYLKYLLFSAMAMLSTSCEKYLDKSPEMGLTDQQVYSSYQSFRATLDKVYVLDFDLFVPTWNGGFFALGDEGLTTATGDPARSINNGNYQDNSSIETRWTGSSTSSSITSDGIAFLSFQNMRTVNICMERINDIKDATQQQKDELLGQAYFYRAWNYFQLIRRYGGFFKFDKPFNSNDDFDLPRLSYQESTDWLVGDLDKAFTLLPDQWPPSDKGRVTKTAALALKGMALLYAASPNMNPDKKYNISYCEKAAQASAKAIEYVNAKGIYKLMPGATVDDYSKIFYSKTQLVSDEAIFYKINNSSNAQPSVSSWNANFIVNSRESGNVHMASPTQNFVDLFETKNGLPINQDPTYNDQDPYTNRDPRFYYDIIYNGLAYNYITPGVRKPFEFWSENTYDSKKSDDYQAVPQYYPRSTYGIRKWLPESCNKWQNDYKYYMQTIHIRVAQLYLDFAEAANEAYGPNSAVPGTTLTALSAINIIRNRVGAVPVSSQFTTSKEIFRDRIYNERSVELAFENQRWHDIRRWRIAIEVMKDIKRPVITRTGPNSFSYRYESVPSDLQKVFEEKHYWYPIPQSQIDIVTKFKQNPGW